MADKRINELPAASAVSPVDLFVLEQSGVAKKLTGTILEQWLLALAAGHGGIVSIDLTSSAGLVDTYTITYADTASQTFTVTNGAEGPRGATGSTGAPATLSNYEVVYQTSASGSVIPTGAWSSSVPTLTQGQFLWTRTTLTFNSGSPVVGYSVSYVGIDGSGSGDMRAAIYDPNGLIAALPGGIPQYVEVQIPAYESSAPPADSENGSAGTNNTIARGNHSHQKDSTKADLVSGKVKPSEASSSIVSVTSSKTLDLLDAGTLQKISSSSDITLTIPVSVNDETLDFPVGTEIEICRYGTGAVTIAGAAGVTIVSADSATGLARQYGCACIKQIAADVWLLVGDIE